jgi:hypothetical protein
MIMCSVHAGHAEVDREEHLPFIGLWAGVVKRESGHEMVVKLGFVFEELDHQEGQAERNGQEQETHLALAFAGLSRVHCQSHRQTAADQDGGVDCAQRHVEFVACSSEPIGVPSPIDHICGEETAEEHNLSHQKTHIPSVPALAIYSRLSK